jgi:hypothetical protein
MRDAEWEMDEAEAVAWASRDAQDVEIGVFGRVIMAICAFFAR